MSELLALLRNRRSIRKFTNKPVTAEQRKLLEEALLRSPTSRGRNPWHFIFIEDPAQLADLANAKEHGSAFLAEVALAVVICADTQISDVWVEDCAIAAITLHYAAHEIGLGSCWVQIRCRQHDEQLSSEAYLKKNLNLPEHFAVASIIGIGTPGEEKQGHDTDTLPTGKIHQNRF